MTNISRHAKATKVGITLKAGNNSVELIGSENGAGIAEHQPSHHDSFGLICIGEHACHRGGTVKNYRKERLRNKGTTDDTTRKKRGSIMSKIKILIADDHPIVREGFKQVLSETPNMVVAGEASNGQEVLDLVRNNRYDVILLDISMPGRSGLEVLKELRSEDHKLPILIVSIYPEEQYAIRAFRAGASGYLTKASAPHELIAAIRKVSSGGRYITSSLAEKLVSYLDIDVTKAPHETLSDREYQVMLMIASGKTVTEIGDELSLSVKTISTYRTHILEKMKVKNNAAITLYAVQNKLME